MKSSKLTQKSFMSWLDVDPDFVFEDGLRPQSCPIACLTGAIVGSTFMVKEGDLYQLPKWAVTFVKRWDQELDFGTTKRQAAELLRSILADLEAADRGVDTLGACKG